MYLVFYKRRKGYNRNTEIHNKLNKKFKNSLNQKTPKQNERSDICNKLLLI